MPRKAAQKDARELCSEDRELPEEMIKKVMICSLIVKKLSYQGFVFTKFINLPVF